MGKKLNVRKHRKKLSGDHNINKSFMIVWKVVCRIHKRENKQQLKVQQHKAKPFRSLIDKLSGCTNNFHSCLLEKKFAKSFAVDED